MEKSDKNSNLKLDLIKAINEVEKVDIGMKKDDNENNTVKLPIR
jgi:hypothetical protein